MRDGGEGGAWGYVLGEFLAVGAGRTVRRFGCCGGEVNGMSTFKRASGALWGGGRAAGRQLRTRERGVSGLSVWDGDEGGAGGDVICHVLHAPGWALSRMRNMPRRCLTWADELPRQPRRHHPEMRVVLPHAQSATVEVELQGDGVHVAVHRGGLTPIPWRNPVLVLAVPPPAEDVARIHGGPARCEGQRPSRAPRPTSAEPPRPEAA